MNQIEQLKEFCRRGGMEAVETLIAEIKAEQIRPKFKESANELVYETGKFEGVEWALQELLDKINYYAKP